MNFGGGGAPKNDAPAGFLAVLKALCFIKKNAFTLSEVLITLGIIGVIAAMTLPAIISKCDFYVRKQQFKKAYNTITQVFLKAEADYGDLFGCHYGYEKNWDCKLLREYVEKNLNTINVCYGNALSKGCIPEYKGLEEVYLQNNPGWDKDDLDNFINNSYSGFSKNSLFNNNFAYVLEDGTIIVLYSKEFILFMIDINGKKGPNKWGYDLFVFERYRESVKSGVIVRGTGQNFVEKGGISSQNMIKEIYK